MTALFQLNGGSNATRTCHPGAARLSRLHGRAKPLPFRRGSQSGQSLIEVSLLMPLLVVLLMGTIDLGRYAYIAILVGNAAHAGALYGARGGVFSVDTTGIQAAADNDYKNNGQDPTKLTVTSSTSCGCDSGGTVTSAVCTTSTDPTAGTCTSGHWVAMVSVTASGTYNMLFPYPGIPSSGTITRTSTMRVALE